MDYELGCILGACICGVLFVYFCVRLHNTTKELEKLQNEMDCIADSVHGDTDRIY